MRPTPWLRAASILTLFHSISHTLGGVFGAPAPGAQQTAVDAMKTNLFPVMGVTRSLWEFYRGMGLGVTIFLTVEAIVFWLLGNLCRSSDADLRPVLAVFLIGYLAFAVNSLIYFFAPPVVVELLIAACLGMAMVSIKRPVARPA
ncbi:LIC_13387 family protein [Edaphobacter modestus]|uniref:DoxX-like protein n=1 Tax=Edaphobacter modestus TaxID=388466 RepID=A0A4Q7YWL3_9BACT|nr:hypothetical protein [Edaphobacter modestus]RZU41581.1 hypothetical protein BDD14_3106 [Edaphobacter modestus]